MHFSFQSTLTVGVFIVPFPSPPLLPLLLPPLLPTEGTEGQMSAEEEEARRIAEMGKPILGEHSRLEVVIEESYEFKVHHSFMYFSYIISSGRTALC